MSKTACRLYPVDIDLMPWDPCEEGIYQRILAIDEVDGAFTRLARIDAGGTWAPTPRPLWSEVFVLSGSLRLAGTVMAEGSYISSAPDEARTVLHALTDTIVIELGDSPGPQMDKEIVSLTAEEVFALPETTPDGSPDGVTHRILSRGSKGSMTRLLNVLPFVATGVFEHDHGEEVLLLEGSYKMGDEFHPTGSYTCKGPGVLHGPFVTSVGYRGLEFRNFSGGL
jgi:hypothetical protein